MICLGDFADDDMVTPLPCDVKHYFHTSCIENWLPYHNSCPLCKVDVTTDGIARVSRDYEEKFKQIRRDSDENIYCADVKIT